MIIGEILECTSQRDTDGIFNCRTDMPTSFFVDQHNSVEIKVSVIALQNLQIK